MTSPSEDQIINWVVIIIVGVIVKLSTAQAAKKVAEKVTLAATEVQNKLDRHDAARATALAGLKFQQNQIQSLVNSSVQELKRLYMVATNRLWRITQTEEDAKLASDATISYHEHVARQEKVDTAKDIGEQIARGELTSDELQAIILQMKTKLTGPTETAKS